MTWQPGPVKKLVIALSMLLGGCVVPPSERCPSCQVVVGTEPFAIRVAPEARTLFVIVPGLLGY